MSSCAVLRVAGQKGSTEVIGMLEKEVGYSGSERVKTEMMQRRIKIRHNGS